MARTNLRPKWRDIYDTVEDHLGRVFIRWAVQWIGRRIFGAVVGGFWGWLIAFAAEKLWTHVISRFARFVTRKTARVVRRQTIKEQLERIRDAENDDDWNDAVDDLA